MFADDALVVIPGPGASAADVVMQYRISGYTGTASPSLEWQSASEETWRGEAQWCFTLPRGRMSVEARAVSTATGGVSEPSAPVAFLVRGMWIVAFGCSGLAACVLETAGLLWWLTSLPPP